MSNIYERYINSQVCIIAEIGVNYYDIAKKHNISNMQAAEEMVLAAKRAGVHAVKFQTYKASTLAAKNSPAYWDTSKETTTSQYELFKKFDAFGAKEYARLSQFCKDIDIEFLSTPFDIESADYLYDMMNIYKISSSDLNNTPFVEYQAKKNKPIILSVGASNADEIDNALAVIKKFNDKKVTLMHCVLEYPTPFKHANLNKIVSLKERYPDCVIGYSDHTEPDTYFDIVKTAYNLGATVIEKHFTLDKTLSGNDHYHAMDESDAKKIIKSIEYLDDIRGSYELKCLDSEMQARTNARRSLVSSVHIKQGEVITKDMLTFKRPGTGIPPSEMASIIGKSAIVDIEEDTIMQFSMLD